MSKLAYSNIIHITYVLCIPVPYVLEYSTVQAMNFKITVPYRTRSQNSTHIVQCSIHSSTHIHKFSLSDTRSLTHPSPPAQA